MVYVLELDFVWTTQQGKILCVGLIGGVGALFSGRKAKSRLEKNRVKYGLRKAEIIKKDYKVTHRLESDNLDVLKETEEEYETKLNDQIRKKRLGGLSKLYFRDKEASGIEFFERMMGIVINFSYFKDGVKLK